MTVLDTDTLKLMGDNAPIGMEGYQYAPFNALVAVPQGREFVARYKAETGNNPSE